MSPLTEPTRIVLRNGWQPMDPDAAAYIAAVESADGQALEEPVKIAIDNFVLGCKADGIWDAIKASCILAGARTLDGALVSLVGTAPTNYNFVSGDYNRKTGLVGDGSTKYLNSNRAGNADGQNNKHAAVYISTSATDTSYYFADQFSYGINLSASTTDTFSRLNSNAASQTTTSGAPNAGLAGLSRSSSSEYLLRRSSAATTITSTSVTPSAFALSIYSRTDTPAFYSNARLAFYSIGEALDLALLDARVTDLINKFAEVIP